MGKRIFFLLILTVLIFALAGVSNAWQGRMGGMGEPYGLIADESDYLIHPAKIASGQGVRLYGDYRFTYIGVLDWNVDIDTVIAPGVSGDISGHEYRHNVLIGAAFPLWLGRMGVLFTYDGQRGAFDGDYTSPTIPANNRMLERDADLDSFAVRLLYGLPLGSFFKLGGEIGFAYCQDEQRNFFYSPDLSSGRVNTPNQNLDIFTPPFIPYDSSYWEISFKAGVEGKVGPVAAGFTLRPGFIVSGDNTLRIEQQAPVGFVTNRFDFDGDVTGWRMGGDLWARYPVAEGVTLPFLFKIDYRQKSRDGNGFASPVDRVEYATEETSFHLQAGGGVEGKLSEKTRIAAGIYYGYLHDRAELSFKEFITGILLADFDHSDYPALTEHRIIVRLAEEHEFSPSFAMRLGLGFFYGWAAEDLTSNIYIFPATMTIPFSLQGSHWGIGGSLGGSIRLKPITLEPFFAVGYQSLKLDGDGQMSINGIPFPLGVIDRADTRNQWNIGGGVSVLFDL